MIFTAGAHTEVSSMPERRLGDLAATTKIVPVCHHPLGDYTFYLNDHKDFPSDSLARSVWCYGLAPKPTIHNPH
jgi:hypothetical protein